MADQQARMTRRAKLQAAIDRLADALPYGHLLASTEPAQLLNNAAHELTELRAKLAAVREVVEEHGCDCMPGEYDDYEPCLACRIAEVLGDACAEETGQ